MILTHRETCRLCESPEVEKVVDLDPIPLTKYPRDREAAANAPRYPIDVYMCATCGHVQQLDVIDPKTLWEAYTYYFGEAKGVPEHCRLVADRFITEAAPPAGGLVVDISSNDGSLLNPFRKAGFRVLGVEPAAEPAERAIAAGISTLTGLISPDLARRIRSEHGPAAIVCALHVFAHADDLGAIADSVRTLLAPDGLFFFEAQYLLDIIDGVLLATIFHEHMSHHSVTPLVPFLEAHGLELIRIERDRMQHGSLIGVAQLRGGQRQRDRSVPDILAIEAERHLTELRILREFNGTIRRLRERTRALADKWKQQGATIAGYGAARSGPTLIIQLGLAGKIDFIVDDHPQKVGGFETGDAIPIVPTSQLLERMPDYTVILAWVHAQKIIENNSEYLERGGRFVVLCPETRIVSKSGELRL